MKGKKLTEMDTQIVNISRIKKNSENPRIIKDDKFKLLVKSVGDFPEMMSIRPIVVNKDMMILGGNMRYEAAKAAGWKEIPIVVADFTKDKEREFIIKDNVSGGEWNWDDLANNWDEELLKDWGLDLPSSFRGDDGVEDDDYEIPSEVETDIVAGDLFRIGPHRLFCGDSTRMDAWERVCVGDMFDCVVTDPPYNVDYVGKTKKSLKIQNDKMDNSSFYNFLYDFYVSMASFTKPGGVWYVWHADSEGANFRLAMANAGIMVKQCLIWVKNTMVMGRQDYQWKHEPCLYGWKEGAAHEWHSDRKQTTVLNFDRPTRNAEHPTMKPVELIAYQIANSTRKGDVVGDGFLGSGTTMVASHQLGRICYGMEIDPVYCQVVIDRMKKLDPNIEVEKLETN